MPGLTTKCSITWRNLSFVCPGRSLDENWPETLPPEDLARRTSDAVSSHRNAANGTLTSCRSQRPPRLQHCTLAGAQSSWPPAYSNPSSASPLLIFIPYGGQVVQAKDGSRIVFAFHRVRSEPQAHARALPTGLAYGVRPRLHPAGEEAHPAAGATNPSMWCCHNSFRRPPGSDGEAGNDGGPCYLI